jgi:hypothetical protein
MSRRRREPVDAAGKKMSSTVNYVHVNLIRGQRISERKNEVCANR